jgi:sporulation protein YlmC with PRC-barrel domain
MTLQALLNKRVLTGDGHSIGHVYDFRARSDNSTIHITHIRVGMAAWVSRLGLHRGFGWLLRGMQLCDIPWEAIAAVDSTVNLKPEWDKARCATCRRQA